jgi:hypothetical protein
MRFDRRVSIRFGDVEVSLHPDLVDPAERQASVREVQHILRDFKYRDSAARDAMLAIYARLGSFNGNLLHHSADDLDVGSPRADAIGRELLSAAEAGIIVLRRREKRTVIFRLEGMDEPVLGPEPDEEAPPSKSWVGIVLVDQDGAPVPNRPYCITKPDGTTIDGVLDSHGTAIVRDLDPGNCQIWCPYVAPQPQKTYTVQQGDHTSGVAQANGFDDYTVVWNDPGNSDLQSQRPDPHVLQPDDVLTIPEIKEQQPANKPTGAKHPFTLKVSPLKVRLKLLDRSAKPLAGVAVTVAGTQLTTDGTGLVETNVDKSAQSLDVQTSDTTYALSVGAINPNDDTSDAGYKARLFNLGFLWDPAVADTSDEMVIALEDFQAQYSLTISGQLDDATKSQLTQSYGS